MTCFDEPRPHVMAAHYRSPTPVGNAGYRLFDVDRSPAITGRFGQQRLAVGALIAVLGASHLCSTDGVAMPGSPIRGVRDVFFAVCDELNGLPDVVGHVAAGDRADLHHPHHP
jgi:hypothetical protein